MRLLLDSIDERHPMTIDEICITEYAKRVFGIFGGEVIRAKLSFAESLVNIVLDLFSQDTH